MSATTTAEDTALSAWLGHAVALTRADSVDHGTYEIALDFENDIVPLIVSSSAIGSLSE